MRDLIKKIIKEDDEWDWTKDTLANIGRLDFIEIAELRSNDNPKNKYKLHYHYYESDDSWMMFDPFNEGNKYDVSLDRFLHFCKFCELETRDIDDEEKVKNYNFYPLEFKQKVGTWSKDMDDEGGFFMDITDWFMDESGDWGVTVWNDSTDEMDTLMSWSITFFDGEGVEHQTKLDIERLLSMNV